MDGVYPVGVGPSLLWDLFVSWYGGVEKRVIFNITKTNHILNTMKQIFG